jgi:hypothetical protein
MNLHTLEILYLKAGLPQILDKLSHPVQMVEPWDAHVMLPPINIDITEFLPAKKPLVCKKPSVSILLT